MTKHEKQIIAVSVTLAACLGVSFTANAMHIMEGALPAGYCIAWGLICLPFLLAGFFSIRRVLQENRRALTLLAMSGAFVFVISSLKIPSVSGSCSHMTGTGLGAILFGPAAMLAHGGLTTLGANTFSMAVAGPFVSYFLFSVLKRLPVNKKISIFLAAFLGDLITYCVTAFQLAIAHNSATSFSAALRENMIIFAGTQLPLAVVEGILTVVVIIGLEAYARPELKAVGFLKEEY